MGVGETITVINRSGKVVSSSKHIVNVFKEAKSAYRERKAEIRAERDAAHAQEKRMLEDMKRMRLEDDVRSHASSRHSRAPHRSRSHRPPPLERAETNNDDARRRSRPHRFESDLQGDGFDGPSRELTRRHTDLDLRHVQHVQHLHVPEPHIDMDLAYGELPPPSPTYSDGELREQASKLTVLLDEANCLHHSVTAIIDNLQKNPEALAAVALTLAEISTLVAKMGPAVLPLLKVSFPAVAALLISPQFMIAAGVGIGITIVALGGYKIIKKIQAQGENPKMMEEPYQAEQLDQLEQLETQELSRIEVWRRGIAEVEADSPGTTVDGEYITPGAERHLVDAGVLDEEDLKSRRKSRVGEDKDRERRSKSHRAKSVKSSKTTSSRSKSTKEDKTKKKEPSLMRTLFRSRTAN